MDVKGECDAIGILMEIKVPPNTLEIFSKCFTSSKGMAMGVAYRAPKLESNVTPNVTYLFFNIKLCLNLNMSPWRHLIDFVRCFKS